jgi:hypothetical protein
MHKYKFSCFKNARSNFPEPMELSWPEFVEFMSHPHTPTPVPKGDDPKKGMPAFSPAIFRPGSTRAVQNVIELSLLVLDMDNSTSMTTKIPILDAEGAPTGRYKMRKHCIPNPVLLDEVHSVLLDKKVDHFLHPTWSDTPDWPHFRVIVPLSRPFPPELWETVTAWAIPNLGLSQVMRGVDQPVLKDTARIYFLPGGPHVR